MTSCHLIKKLNELFAYFNYKHVAMSTLVFLLQFPHEYEGEEDPEVASGEREAGGGTTCKA